jgi:hypothetical protein
MTDDPNEAYEVVPLEPAPHGPPEGWWTVKRNGIPVRHFPGKEKAQRYASKPCHSESMGKGEGEIINPLKGDTAKKRPQREGNSR